MRSKYIAREKELVETIIFLNKQAILMTYKKGPTCELQKDSSLHISQDGIFEFQV